jgi:4-hydroxybenzoate polyprenyltransferase
LSDLPAAPPAPPERGAPIPLAALRALRPKQWTKNGLLFAALIFSGAFHDPQAIGRALLGFAAFCLMSSSGYVLNDTLDREADRLHPKKRLRPIASGELPVSAAWVTMALTLSLGLLLASQLGTGFLIVGLAYLSTTLSYSYVFKHMVILDVMFLASGFVWRAIAGALAIAVPVSPWLLLCTAFLALWLGFNKRRAELRHVGAGAGTRKNLAQYNQQMLASLESIVTSNTVLSYSLYAVLGPTPWMALTIPFVLYGIFRYVYLVEQLGEGGAPDETLLKDRPLQATVVLYGLTAIAVLLADERGLLPKLEPSDLGRPSAAAR